MEEREEVKKRKGQDNKCRQNNKKSDKRDIINIY